VRLTATEKVKKKNKKKLKNLGEGVAVGYESSRGCALKTIIIIKRKEREGNE